MKRPPFNINCKACEDHPAILRAAAEWRSRLDDGLSAEEEEELAAWIQADERHAMLFGEMDATWKILDRTSELPLAGLAPSPPTGNIRRWWAARRKASRYAALAAAACLALVAGAAGWRTSSSALQFTVNAYAEPGLFQRINLPDGSVVRLNSEGSVLVEFTKRERRIVLERGEATFDVASDPARPFTVQTPGVQVRAMGTVFHVALRSQAVEVLVTEGRVKVEDSTRGRSLLAARTDSVAPQRSNDELLGAGEKVVIEVRGPTAMNAAVPVVVAPAEVARALAWQERRLEFSSTRLGSIAAEFNRFNQHKLVIADPQLAEQQFGGSFRADDPDTFIELIAMRPGLTVERSAGKTIIRQSK